MHSNHKHVEYRGEIVELTNSLLQLPAGGQVLLSDTTFQRIGGRLHEVKLPAFHFQKAAEGPRNSIEGQPRKDLGGQIELNFEVQSKRNLDGQTKGTERQGSEPGSNPSSRRSSIDSMSRLAVRFYTRTSHVNGIGACTNVSFVGVLIASDFLLYTQRPEVSLQTGT